MLDTMFNSKDFIFVNDTEMLNAVKKDLTHEQFEANAYKVKGE